MAQLVRRDPFDRELGSLARRFNRMAERLNRAWGMEPWQDAESELYAAWAPTVDIYDRDNEIVVQAELPGMKKEDIDIRIEDGVLMLSGKRERQSEVSEAGYYHAERSYGSFGRSFRLPSTVKAEKIEAAYKDGLLTIKVPKAEEAKPKQIQIK